MGDLDISQLCELANVTPRTVHFYVQQGLLPAPDSPGPGPRYTSAHVARIRLIRLLQKQHLPLAEIARRLRGLTYDQVLALVEETAARRRAESGSSAIDYIRGVLAKSPTIDSRFERLSAIDASAMPSSAATVEAPATARSQWERYTLADGMELHVRRPLSRIQQRQLEQLLAAARQILQEEES